MPPIPPMPPMPPGPIIPIAAFMFSGVIIDYKSYGLESIYLKAGLESAICLTIGLEFNICSMNYGSDSIY